MCDIAINRAKITGSINEAISPSETMHVSNDLGAIQSLDIPPTPINKIFKETETINNAESLIDILNASTPFDKGQNVFRFLIRCYKNYTMQEYL